jgi:hypothetical protein
MTVQTIKPIKKRRTTSRKLKLTRIGDFGLKIIFPEKTKLDTEQFQKLKIIIFDNMDKFYNEKINANALQFKLEFHTKADADFLQDEIQKNIKLTKLDEDPISKFNFVIKFNTFIDSINSVMKHGRDIKHAKANIISYTKQASQQYKLLDQLNEAMEKRKNEKYKFKLEVKFEKHPAIKRVSITKNNEIKIETENLYAKDPRTDILHDVGVYSVVIPILSIHGGYVQPNFSAILVQNTKLGNVFNGRPAIHAGGSSVGSGRYACLGTFHAEFIKCFTSKEINVTYLQALIIDFLTSANTEDAWGMYVHRAPIANIKDNDGKILFNESRDINIKGKHYPSHTDKTKRCDSDCKKCDPVPEDCCVISLKLLEERGLIKDNMRFKYIEPINDEKGDK